MMIWRLWLVLLSVAGVMQVAQAELRYSVQTREE